MAITVIAIIVAFVISRSRHTEPLPVLFSVPEFTLTNQSGQQVSASTLRGQVWLADIIFTRCAGPCPEMTRTMAELQASIKPTLPVRFLTLTADPGYDTPPVLAAYARRFGADPARWHFLTGTKKEINRVAIDGLKLTSMEKDASTQQNPDDLFIHSTIFVLVDGQGRARAVFESDDSLAKSKMLDALANLLKEGQP